MNTDRIQPKDYTILIVDDSPSNIKVLGNALRSYGFDFEYATSGSNALELLSVVDVDLLLLDIMMPEIDGFEVCKTLRDNAKFNDLPIIFLTAKADKDSIIKGFDYGGQDYVVKPFDINELMARVFTHLELRSKRLLLKDTNKVLEHQVKQRTLELANARDKAEESDRLKSVFLANMSHEIRTPMNGILGFTALLKEPDLSKDDQSEYITVIEDCGKHLLNIINDLVDISRVEAGLVKVNKEPVNVNKQIIESYKFFKLQTTDKNIDLEYHLDSSLTDPMIYTDADKLYALLTNLVKNAIKFTTEGAISFGYILKDDFLQFFVKDTGIGIEDYQQSQVFKRFRQADPVTGVFQEGNGLGLSIAKAYVEMLGGDIYLESKLGVGSTFYFTIPLERS